MIKISFTGDVMSSSEQDAAVEKIGSYNRVFSSIAPLFKESSYVVANLETTISGPKLGYTNEPASFNTPEGILPALKKMGVSLVTNANNHILDRGIEGMFQTIDALDKNGLEHTGCYRNVVESEKIFIKQWGKTRIAFLSYTYGTNSEFNGNLLSSSNTCLIDLLKQQPEFGKGGFQTKHNSTIKAERLLHGELLGFYKKLERWYYRRRPYIGGSCIDTVNEIEINNPNHGIYLERLKEKVDLAKRESDIVILCLHCGGQYNDEIGEYTRFIFNYLKKLKIDIVIGNHPHCILGHRLWRQHLSTYSLGNFSFSPGGAWYVDTILAEYSVVLHVYIDEISKVIKQYTFSIVKNIIGEDRVSRVYETSKLIEEESNFVEKKQLIKEVMMAVKRFTGRVPRKIAKEYLLGNNNWSQWRVS